MSLKKIGNLTNAIKSGEGISDALGAFGNANDAAKALSKYSDLGTSTKYDLLSSVFDEVPESAMKILTKTGQGGIALSGLAGIGESISAIGTGLISFLGSILPALAVVGTITAGVAGFHFLNDKFTLTKGMADKHYSKST